MIALLAVAMMSCGFNTKVNSLEKACKAGNMDKAEEIYKEIQEKYKDDIKNEELSEEQMNRLFEVQDVCEKAARDKEAEEAKKKLYEYRKQAESAYDELNTDEESDD